MCIHVCVYIHIYIYILMYMHVYMHMCVYIYIYIWGPGGLLGGLLFLGGRLLLLPELSGSLSCCYCYYR